VADRHIVLAAGEKYGMFQARCLSDQLTRMVIEGKEVLFERMT
jgi:hypothetical protein